MLGSEVMIIFLGINPGIIESIPMRHQLIVEQERIEYTKQKNQFPSSTRKESK